MHKTLISFGQKTLVLWQMRNMIFFFWQRWEIRLFSQL